MKGKYTAQDRIARPPITPPTMAPISLFSRPLDAEAVGPWVEVGLEVALGVALPRAVVGGEVGGGIETEISGPFAVPVVVAAAVEVMKNDEAYSSMLDEAYERMLEQMSSKPLGTWVGKVLSICTCEKA